MTPKFRILSNGNDVTVDYADRLISLEVVDSVDEQTDSLTIVLDTAIQGEEPLPVPQRGERFEVWLGSGNAFARIANAFVVEEIEFEGPPDTLTIIASSTPFTADDFQGTKSLVTRRSASYTASTVATIIQAVAKRNGLEASVDSELGAQTIDHIDQTNESDLNFLLKLARQAGGVLKPADGKIVLAQESGGVSTSGKNASITITLPEVSHYRVKQGTKLNDVKAAKVKYHDYNQASTMDAAHELEGSDSWKMATETK